jgi:catalase
VPPRLARAASGGPHADAALASETTTNYGVVDEVIRSAYKRLAQNIAEAFKK